MAQGTEEIVSITPGGIVNETPALRATDLDATQLRDVISEGVYRGVLKAVAVYALISLLIWVIASVISSSNRYG